MSSFRCGTATARGQASLGGSSTRVGRPGRKEPGTPEGVPRTTAITRHRGHKKSACDEDWALLRLSIPTGQGRIADASATGGIYPYVPAYATVGALRGGHTRCRKDSRLSSHFRNAGRGCKAGQTQKRPASLQAFICGAETGVEPIRKTLNLMGIILKRTNFYL